MGYLYLTFLNPSVSLKLIKVVRGATVAVNKLDVLDDFGTNKINLFDVEIT